MEYRIKIGYSGLYYVEIKERGLMGWLSGWKRLGNDMAYFATTYHDSVEEAIEAAKTHIANTKRNGVVVHEGNDEGCEASTEAKK